MKFCPKCNSQNNKKSGMIGKNIMSKSGKKKRQLQSYRCENGHFFTLSSNCSYTNSFIEWVVFVYLNCLSLNTTIEIVRAYYEDEVLSKATILDFLEQVADASPNIDDTNTVFNPKRSGYIALDGVWFTFRGREVVMLVCFDPETFDVIDAIWSLAEDEEGYTALLLKVAKQLGTDTIKGIYGDGDKGLISSLKKHFPLIPFQLCVVHKEMRMGQVVPVKSINVSKQMSEEVRNEIREFQEKFREVLYANTKKASMEAFVRLKAYAKESKQERFKKAVRSLQTNFHYTLTHFDHKGMHRDNNLIECFNGILKPRLKLMRGFKKYENMDRYLKLFVLDFRFHALKESRFEERRGLCPLQSAGVKLPHFYNFLSFLRYALELDFTQTRT